MKTFQAIIIFVLVILAGFGGYSIYNTLVKNTNKQDDRVYVTIDKTVIVQKVQGLSNLETVKMTLQRDVEIVLDAGDVSLFGQKIAERRSTQKYAVTGSVSAGVNLSNIQEEDVTLDEASSKVTIKIPAPVITNTELDEDKTTLLSQDLTILFVIENINSERRRQLNDELLDQAIKQSRNALKSAACDDEILEKAAENAKVEVAKLFTFAGVKDVEVEVDQPEECYVEEKTDE